MNLESTLTALLTNAVKVLYGLEIEQNQIQLQKTKKEFTGDLTVVIFPFVKAARKSPEQTGQQIGEYLLQNSPIISDFNVIKGFLNLSISKNYWLEALNEIHKTPEFGKTPVTESSELMMIEYSSPNTNKPLHLGHIRNNLLGHSIAEIQKANGWKVVKTNIVNDRGIHICKSMLAWKLFGNGETPQSSGLKGDHLVGKYYVIFDKAFKKKVKDILSKINDPVYLEQSLPENAINDICLIKNKIVECEKLIKKEKNQLNIDQVLIQFRNDKFFKDETINNIENWYKSNVEIGQIFVFINNDNSANSNLFEKAYESFRDVFDNILSIEEIIKNYHKFIKEIVTQNNYLMLAAREMLLAWENNDSEVRQLWETMNGWVYAGFDKTYDQMGVSFDKIYYESQTYLEGKSEVERGEANKVFYRREDGSVWADLTGDGLDEKLLLRADGTSVYMTQDIGTAKLRYNDFPINKMVYVVGNEQNYHFQVLAILLDKLGFEWGKSLVHFSYGMVELPEGKMKSREGTVVDADDLMDEMIQTARETSQELGKLDNCTPEEIEAIVRMVGLGSLKYFILKVDPRKNMTFNPKESIDFNGNTGPFIQYTHARIKSVLRKGLEQGINFSKLDNTNLDISEKESYLVQLITEFPAVIRQAGEEFSPALIANYIYDLVKEYNQFYHDFTILKEENQALKQFRLVLSETIASIIKTGMGLLGIDVPERM